MPANQHAITKVLNDGTTSVLLDHVRVHDLVLDDTSIYFGTEDGVWKLSKQGGAPALVVPTSAALTIAVDSNAIYWMNRANELRRIAK